MLSTADGLSRPARHLATSDHPFTYSGEMMLARPHRAAARESSFRARRFLNVCVAIVALIITAPLMVLIAIAIKLTSQGPVLYKQTRVGVDRRRGSGGNWRRRVDYGGKLFTMYKFRTMTAAAGSEAEQVWAQPDDPRVTAIGRILRKLRLDELPQFINVLKGEMNVVGPRPEQPRIFVSLREQVDRYHERQTVLPGITGWAQVNQHYDTCVEDVVRKLELDLQYARGASVGMDLQIMAKTIPVVLYRKGAW
jgi:lipopolysaccharide/colanic/teichoic acid biosynthesis glycosyltransferase